MDHPLFSSSLIFLRILASIVLGGWIARIYVGGCVDGEKPEMNFEGALELKIGRRVKDDFLHSDDDASLPPATLVLLMVAA